jgi:hypothetical protein
MLPFSDIEKEFPSGYRNLENKGEWDHSSRPGEEECVQHNGLWSLDTSIMETDLLKVVFLEIIQKYSSGT